MPFIHFIYMTSGFAEQRLWMLALAAFVFVYEIQHIRYLFQLSGYVNCHTGIPIEM